MNDADLMDKIFENMEVTALIKLVERESPYTTKAQDRKNKHKQPTKEHNQDKRGYVYVLELVGGKYYVGFAPNLENRLAKHFNGVGSEVTKECPPIRVVLTREGTLETEWKITKAIAERIGWYRVRGGYRSQRFSLDPQ